MLLNQFSDFDIQQQVLDFMRSIDCEPADNSSLVMDGNIHRYRLSGDKKGELSGAYCIHTDGLPAGWVEDWHTGNAVKWRFNTSGLSQEQRDYFNSQEFRKKAEEDYKRKEAKRKQKQAEASEHARILWESLKEAPETHPYLKAKQVYPYGIRVNDSSLAVPLRDINNNIMSIQWIDAEGSKRFFTDAPLDGAFWSIALDTLKEHPDYPILLGEGFATMAKVHELTSCPCVAAISCYFLKNVAEKLKAKYSKSKIIILADNDIATEAKRGFNPGISHAMDTVKAGLAVAVITPNFLAPEDGSDWDDYALRYGNESTASLLKDKIRWECMSEQEKHEANACKSLAAISTSLDRHIQIPPEDFIGGIFPRKRISAVIAAPGTGKTWFLQKFVSDLSTGGSIFDGFAEEDTPKKSLIFAGEAGPALMIRRAADTRWPVNIQNVNIYGMIDAEKKGISLMLDEGEGRENIERTIRMHRPDIIWFDTLSSFHNKDENKSIEMKPIFRWLLTIAEIYDIAVVLMHHSRKRLAKERKLALTQDDVIGSSIFNRLVSVIISIEPTEEDNKTLMVKSLKSWFTEFIPFTYKLVEGEDGHTVMKVDLAPESIANSKTELWDYIRRTFAPDEWFKASDVYEAVKGIMNLRQLQRYLSALVSGKKIRKRGQNKWVEYSVIGFYSKE